MSLAVGQIVRYERALWRVDYVNDCRARLVPLAKRHVELPNGATFEGEMRGVNVSPNSVLEAVEDPERARDELELAAAEAELARLRREATVDATPPGPVEAARIRQERAVVNNYHIVDTRPRGSAWHLVGAVPEAAEGSLKDLVLTYIAEQPGHSTQQIQHALASVATTGAVAACLDRFMKAGVLARR